MRVIDRVHGDTTHGWTNTTPALGSGLTQFFQVVLGVGDLADRGPAAYVNLSRLPGPQHDGRVLTLTGHQLGNGSGAARQLSALTGLELHVVDLRTDRNGTQHHCVARLDRCLRPADDRVAGAHVTRSQDVSAVSVHVFDQRNVRAAVRIVFDPLDNTLHTVLDSLEINDAVVVLVATTLMARRDPTGVVTATRRALRLQQGCVRTTRP